MSPEQFEHLEKLVLEYRKLQEDIDRTRQIFALFTANAGDISVMTLGARIVVDVPSEYANPVINALRGAISKRLADLLQRQAEIGGEL